MGDSSRAVLFAAMAAVCAGSTAPLIADKSISRGFIVLPLLFMGVLLLAAGYYAGRSSGGR